MTLKIPLKRLLRHFSGLDFGLPSIPYMIGLARA